MRLLNVRLNTKMKQAEYMWSEYEAECVADCEAEWELNGKLNRKLKCEAEM